MPVDRFLFGSAILFRLLWLGAVPQLSDDVYRFVWDGRLLWHGFNPYLYRPDQIVQTPEATVARLGHSLFSHLNSPHYFTVYPPFNQVLFGLAAGLSGKHIFWNIVWLRVPILLSEVGTLWLLVKLLRRLRLNPNRALLYGLNPLVILELTGNLHFEAVILFFTLLAIWWLGQGRWVASAGVAAMAVVTKLLPIMLLPLVLRRENWLNQPRNRRLTYAALIGGLTLLLFAPFASVALVRNLLSSLNLYVQKFEFNASVYYLLRAVGYWIGGNYVVGRVGLALALATTLGILRIALGKGVQFSENLNNQYGRESDVAVRVLAIFTLYYALATTVHPWYITTVMAAALFTSFRYPFVWSALIFVSYAAYQTQPYYENLWLTTLEYAVVTAVGLWEVRAKLYPKYTAKPSESSAF